MAGRIPKETQRLLAEPVEGVSATPYEDNMRYFNVAIAGPAGTPYEGGLFRLELFLPAGLLIFFNVAISKSYLIMYYC